MVFGFLIRCVGGWVNWLGCCGMVRVFGVGSDG